MFNDVYRSFMRSIGRILAYLVVGGIIAYIAMMGGCENVKAHVVVETHSPDTMFGPSSDSSIMNPGASWGLGYRPSNLTTTSPWLISIGQYEYKDNLSGVYLSVESEYYFGVAFNTASSSILNNWLDNSRNTLTANNLRCGIGGDYKSGYDSSFAPIVTNFSVTLKESLNPSGMFYHHTYVIKFQYNQQIRKITNYSGNVSCWFERNPDNGLFAQIIDYDGIAEFSYYNKTFKFNVSNDPNTAILDNIESGINETNDKLDDVISEENETQSKIDENTKEQQKTNEELGKLNENISNSDSSEATNQASSFFSGFQSDTFGLTSIITAPLNLINSITSSTCSDVGLPLPYVEQTLKLPCMSTIYKNHFGSFLSIYQIITFGIVSYWVCVRIFNMVKDFKNPNKDEIEVIDL